MIEETMAIEHREELRAQPVKPLEEISLWEDLKEWTVRIGTNLLGESKKILMEFLRANSEVFAWSHNDMPGIDPKFITHKLSLHPEVKPVIQRKRIFASKRSQVIKEEFKKLLKSRFIREVNYPSWLANVVTVKKANGK